MREGWERETVDGRVINRQSLLLSPFHIVAESI
jgi:hypothetical protein